MSDTTYQPPAEQLPDGDQRSTPAYHGKARIVCTNGLPSTAMLTVGATMIPFYEATIKLKVGEWATIEAKIPAEQVDVQALQEHTELTVISHDDSDAHRVEVKVDPGVESRA